MNKKYNKPDAPKNIDETGNPEDSPRSGAENTRRSRLDRMTSKEDDIKDDDNKTGFVVKDG